MSEHREYAARALERIKTGELKAGSHLVGVFGIAASGLEIEFRMLTAQVLEDAQLRYGSDVRPAIQTGSSSFPGDFEKLTLGQLRGVAGWMEKQHPGIVTARVKAKWSFAKLAAAVDRVNKTWIAVKHGQEPKREQLIDGLHDVHALLGALDK